LRQLPDRRRPAIARGWRPGTWRVWAVAAVLGLSTLAAAGPVEPVAGKPRLVLVVSVDQMRFDYLTRFADLFEGGFKRLLERGAVFSNARYRHANTETGPGHALLLTGRHAPDTGIVANDWYDGQAGRSVNVVDDFTHAALPGPGRAASPANTKGETIGDLLKKVSPGSRVVGVSSKDRSAILMAGRSADAAYWYEVATGGFGTSSYYMSALPEWLSAWNRAGHVDALHGQTWTRLVPDEAVYRRYAGEDAVPGEWDNVDVVFPHKIRGEPRSREFYDDLRRTPFADELTLDVALQAMEAHGLGDDDATDLLAVGFSTTDFIGHTYGPDSQEQMDQILRLDRVLERLLAATEARTGGRVLVCLSADHGAMPLVERLKGSGVDARRLGPDDLKRPVLAELDRRFGAGESLIAFYDAPNFYLNLAELERRSLKREDVEATIERALLSTGFVERVYTHATLRGEPGADDPDFALFRASFYEPRSPHVMARLKPYVYLSSYLGGTGHGTVQDYDRHVPVAFLGPGIKPGRYEAASGPEDIAPTLARLLGLDYRIEEGQRVLDEALP
jgi:predicted AlkP superfamily pyrophosphatase or phosphodiesterase